MSLLLVQVLLLLHGSEHLVQDAKVFMDVLSLHGEVDDLFLSLAICANDQLTWLKLISLCLTRSVISGERGAKLESHECIQ